VRIRIAFSLASTLIVQGKRTGGNIPPSAAGVVGCDAELVRTSQPAIARLENTGYDGHSLGMFRRFANALRLQLEMRLIPDQEAT
jgi:hypothetical protein